MHLDFMGRCGVWRTGVCREITDSNNWKSVARLDLLLAAPKIKDLMEDTGRVGLPMRTSYHVRQSQRAARGNVQLLRVFKQVWGVIGGGNHCRRAVWCRGRRASPCSAPTSAPRGAEGSPRLGPSHRPTDGERSHLIGRKPACLEPIWIEGSVTVFWERSGLSCCPLSLPVSTQSTSLPLSL